MKHPIKFFVDDITAPWGLEQAVIRLSNNFVSHGHSVSIVSFYSEPREILFDIDRRIIIEHLCLKNTLTDVNYAKRILGFINLIRSVVEESSGARIIISASSFISIALPFCKIRRGSHETKLITWEHGVYDAAGKVLKYFRLLMYRYVDNIVVLTKSQQSVYSQKRFSTPAVIPNEAPQVKHDDLKLQKEKILISVGRLSHEKGFDILITDIHPVLEKYPDWKLEIYGDGPLRDQLEDLADSLGASKQVKLYPRTSEIMKKYLNSSVYLMASRYESFGLVLVEAQTYGLPVVAYDCESGPREIVHHEKDGFLIPMGRADLFRDSVIKLINDKDLYESMSNQSSISSLSFSSENIYSGWCKVFSGM